MKEKIDFETLKPKLKECSIYLGENKLLLEHPTTHTPLILPLEAKNYIEFLTGEYSLKEIASKVYTTHGHVSINSILANLYLLKQADFLEEGELPAELEKKFQEELAVHENKDSLFFTPLWESTLIKKIELSLENQFLNSLLHGFFYLFVCAIFGVLIFSFQKGFWNLSWKGLLNIQNSYHHSLLHLILISSLLFTGKALFKALLLFLSTGKVYHPSLKIYPFALSLGSNEDSIHIHPHKIGLFCYGLTNIFLYLFLASLISFMSPWLSGLFPSHLHLTDQYIHSMKIMALLFTLIDLDPYRLSDLSKLFHLFFSDEQLKNMMPYLKNCSLSPLSPLSSKGEQGKNEWVLLSYSILALLWAVGFAFFSIDLLVSNLPLFLFEIQIGTSLGKVSAVMLGLSLVAIFGQLTLDLVHTMTRNIMAPLSLPFSRLTHKAKKYEKSEINAEVIQEILKETLYFNQLNQEAHQFLIQNSEIKFLPKGKNLFTQGSKFQYIFVILKGNLEINIKEETGRIKKIATFGPKAVLGEQSFLQPSCTTKSNGFALENLVYLEIKQNIFEELLNKEEFQEQTLKMKKLIEVSSYIASAGLFRDFPPEMMTLFVEAGDLVVFPKDHEIVTQGELDKTFYLLVQGRVEILKSGKSVAELQQGDFFGEIALIADTPRTASVNTLEDCLFLYIEDKKFWKILSENIEVAMYIENIGKERMAA